MESGEGNAMTIVLNTTRTTHSCNNSSYVNSDLRYELEGEREEDVGR